MTRFTDREGLAGKIIWEGGIYESLHYGIKTEDMPEGDEELAAAWADMQDAWKALEGVMGFVEELLEEYL